MEGGHATSVYASVCRYVYRLIYIYSRFDKINGTLSIYIQVLLIGYAVTVCYLSCIRVTKFFWWLIQYNLSMVKSNRIALSQSQVATIIEWW